MSLKCIYLFQSRLYELLSSHALPKVYLSMQKDEKYPFILVNLQKVLDISEHYLITYDVDFEICVFARDKAQEALLTIAHKVLDIISPQALSNKSYDVLGVKNKSIEWVRGHDLLTTKLILEYKLLIQGRNV